MAITEKRGRPIGVLISSASTHEVRLVEPTLDACFVSEVPVILIGDKPTTQTRWMRPCGIVVLTWWLRIKRIAKRLRRKMVVVCVGINVASR